MAKNYTFAEAVEIINAGTDMESIADIGRRYPILMHQVTKVTTKAGDDFVKLMSFMPDHLTANKVNMAMKNNVGSDVSDDTDDDEAEVNADVNDEKPAKESKAVSSGSNYESMSGKELWDILGKAGKRKDCKDKMGGTKKDLMIEYINKYGLGEVEVEAEEADEVEADEPANPYSGKSAMELFKECKKRGIKAEAKKPAKFYVELLTKADAEAKDDDAESDVEEDDGWGDEAEEPKVEKKATKKAAKKPANEEAEDEDDDWDI